MGKGGRLAAGLAVVVGVIGLVAVLVVGGGEEPVEYEVVRGDTLFVIAKAHGVTVEDLQSWNGLASDRIDVGQVLVIWPGDEEDPLPGRKRARKTAPSSPVVAAPEAPGQTHAPLVMPPERPCRAGPSVAASDEPTMAASTGLSREDIIGTMDGFLHHTTRCVTGGVPEGTLRMEIHVACTGRVSGVDVVKNPGWSGEVVSCVQEVLGYAPFPAHALPDGDVFGYPLSFGAAP